jgi:hypothetical protein
MSAGSRSFHHSDAKFSLWGSILFDRRDGLLEQCMYLLSVRKEAKASFTGLHTMAVPDE